ERRLPYRIGRNVSSVAKIEASSDLVEWVRAGNVVLDATGTGSFEGSATDGRATTGLQSTRKRRTSASRQKFRGRGVASGFAPAPHDFEALLYGDERRIEVLFIFDNVPLGAAGRFADVEDFLPRQFVFFV